MKLKMQKLQKPSKMLLITLLMLGAASSGCVSKAPSPPSLDIYIHDLSNSVAYGKNSEGAVLKPISIKETDKWFMFSPQSWESVQNYVDLLICVIDGGCSAISQELGMDRQEALARWQYLKKTMNEMRGTL